MFNLQASELSILLVEPSSTQLKIIIRQLQQAGVTKIEGVTSGESAKQFIQQYPPDLVISAMYLPDMTAAELLLSIRDTPETEQCLFMLISSETNFRALEPLRQAGVMAILPKPFELTDLQRALRTTLEYIDPEEIALENYDVTQLKVLLVDDSLTARNHLSRVLTDMGIGYIAKADNGVSAVEMLKNDDFDLIVTDLNMPEMDGHQLVTYIRDEMGNTFIPILMVTSEKNNARLGQVEQSGVSAILDKPFEPKTIRDILYRVLDEGQ